MRNLLLTLAAFLMASAAPFSQAAIYDLAADWSDSQNPNSAWSYEFNGVPLTTHLTDWGIFASPQPAWATDVAQPPAWMSRADMNSILPQVPVGAVLTHTPNDAAHYTDVKWASPSEGTITISGGLLAVGTAGRQNHWQLLLNGDVIASADATTGTTPYASYMDNLLTGKSLTGLPVSAGDIVELRMNKLPDSPFGDMFMTDLSVNLSAVPEPSTYIAGALLLLPFGMQTIRRLRK